MCRFLSVVVLRNGDIRHHPLLDSHSDLIAYFKLPDTSAYHQHFAKAELTPPRMGTWTDASTWTWRIDEATRPGWLDDVEGQAEAATRRLVERMVIRDERAILADGVWIIAEGARIKRCIGGRLARIEGGTVEAIEGGTVQAIEGGTVEAIKGGTVQAIWGGTVQAIWGGTVQAIKGGTVQAIKGGTVQAIWGGTVQAIKGGTVQAIWGGTVQAIEGGTVQAIKGGTVQAIWGGTVQAIKGGTVQAIKGGTVPAREDIDTRWVELGKQADAYYAQRDKAKGGAK